VYRIGLLDTSANLSTLVGSDLYMGNQGELSIVPADDYNFKVGLILSYDS
jgi:hypothetical protein